MLLWKDYCYHHAPTFLYHLLSSINLEYQAIPRKLTNVHFYLSVSQKILAWGDIHLIALVPVVNCNLPLDKYFNSLGGFS